jgi:hypothetical protein
MPSGRMPFSLADRYGERAGFAEEATIRPAVSIGLFDNLQPVPPVSAPADDKGSWPSRSRTPSSFIGTAVHVRRYTNNRSAQKIEASRIELNFQTALGVPRARAGQRVACRPVRGPSLSGGEPTTGCSSPPIRRTVWARPTKGERFDPKPVSPLSLRGLSG